MAHKLETSILHFSQIIEKQTNNAELVNLARSLASWSSKYSAKNNDWDTADANYHSLHKILKNACREKDPVS